MSLRPPRARDVSVALAATVVFSISGCAPQSGLEVEVRGPNIAAIRHLELTLSSGAVTDVLSYPRRGGGQDIALPQTVGVRFPRETGSVSIDVRALDRDGAIVGAGSGTAVLASDATVSTVVILTPVASAACGNMVVEDPETCDDGNSVPDDGCLACALECGDGVLGANELCDDGNRVDGDACSADCTTAFAFIETVAGGPAASPDGAAPATTQLIGPRTVRVGPASETCWAEAYRIRCIDGTTVVTVVGRGTAGYSGDGGSATDAEVWYPIQFDWDSAGNLYFTDGYYHAVRRVDAITGEVTLYAGDPRAGDHRDGVATAARFMRPFGLVIDDADVLYVSELLGHTIRRIEPDGTVTTLAGDYGAPGATGNGGPAATALLDGPGLLALDPGSTTLYFADTGNFQIRAIALASGVVSLVAGNGSSGPPMAGGPATGEPLLSVDGVDAGADGAIRFIMGRQEVWHVSGGVLTREAFTGHVAPCLSLGPNGDGGDPRTACMESAIGLATNGSEVLVADFGDGRIRRYLPSGLTSTTTVAGSPTAAPANADPHDVKLYAPTGIAREGADLLFIDNVGARILRAANDTSIITVAGNLTWGFGGDTGAAATGTFENPFGFAVHTTLGILVADLGNNRIRAISSNIITTVAGDGTTVFVDGSPATMTGLYGPSAVADDGSGGFYIAEYTGGRIFHVVGGNLTLVAGGGVSTGDGAALSVQLVQPLDMRLRPDGKLLFAEGTRVRKYDPANLTVTTVAGLPVPTMVVPGPDANGDGGPAAGATFRRPSDVAIAMDGTTVYVVDALAGAIRVFSEGGVINTLAGGDDDFVGLSRDGTQPELAELDTPWRLYVDPGTGWLYVAELGNHDIRRIVFP